MANVDQTIVTLAQSELLWRDFFRFTALKHARANIGRASAAAEAKSPSMPALAVA